MPLTPTDYLAIGDALAAKYARGTLTPPSGYTAVHSSTCRPPNAIPQSPWVLVVLPTGTAVIGAQQFDWHLEFHVLFHYARSSADKPRDWKALMKWLGPLLYATFNGMTLGLSASGVRKAYPLRWDQVVMTYGGTEFYGWDLTVRVDLHETIEFVP